MLCARGGSATHVAPGTPHKHAARRTEHVARAPAPRVPPRPAPLKPRRCLPITYPADAPIAPMTHRKILIVDDEPAVLEAMRAQLARSRTGRLRSPG